MKKSTSKLMRLLSITSLAGLLAACGASDSDGTAATDSTSKVSIRFSDFPVENARSVVITVDTMIFNRANGDDIVVNQFTSPALGLVEADTFTIDLLDYQGTDSAIVLDSVDLPIGEYENLRLKILDEDINFSYVEEYDSGLTKPIKVPSDELKLGRFTVSPLSTQSFVVEFDLHQALTYNPGPQRYILKPRGVRVVGLENAAMLSGFVDLNKLNAKPACSGKPDITRGNSVYLYQGHNLLPSMLGDLVDPSVSATFPPEGTILPVAAFPVSEIDELYVFSYLLPGEYTLAFSCIAEDDDPETYEAIAIPSPVTELVEVNLLAGQSKVCDFPVGGSNCD